MSSNAYNSLVISGILKAILSFQKNVIPPQPYLLDLNDEIDFEASKIVVPREVTAFVDVSTPRLIGISSFATYTLVPSF